MILKFRSSKKNSVTHLSKNLYPQLVLTTPQMNSLKIQEMVGKVNEIVNRLEVINNLLLNLIVISTLLMPKTKEINKNQKNNNLNNYKFLKSFL